MRPSSSNHAAKKCSETLVKKLIAISILLKNLFTLLNLYMKKFHTATNRLATGN